MKRAILALIVVCVVSYGYSQDFLSKAKVALGVKDTATAVTNFEQALKAGQKPAEVNYYLGAIKYARGQYPDAKKYLDEAVRIDEYDNPQSVYKTKGISLNMASPTARDVASLSRSAS